MTKKCITVFTKDYEVFSDIYEEILHTSLGENEEKEIEGVTISDAGEVPENYLEKMRLKPKVAVMNIKEKGIVIMQHGEVFEILLPAL